jgi:LacI family transcriptional regulator
MVRRPTIRDLAAAAGVSVATVDRVLNARHPVREETARRVYDAATRLGYHATGLIRQRLKDDLPQVKLGFLLQKQGQHFYQAFERELGAAVGAAGEVRASAVIEFVPSLAPGDVVAALEALARRAQAIGMVAPDHPSVTAAVEGLRDRGVPVFSLLSDFAPGVREGYVGVDNRKAGRTAAWMIARAAPRPGKVAVFVGSHRFHGHELREIGFRAYFREHAPGFEVLETLVNLETRQITHEATLSLLQRYPDLVGVYVAGGGMEGAVAALREEGLAGRLAVVVNEITPESRAGLAEGLVTMALATPLPALCREVVALMVGAVRDGMAGAPGQTFLPFEIHLPESI